MVRSPSFSTPTNSASDPKPNAKPLYPTIAIGLSAWEYENDRKLIVNCLPLTESERAQFTRAAKGMPQEFVGDPAQRGCMNWTAAIPEELKA